MILLILACSADLTGIPVTVDTRMTTEGTVVDQSAACGVEVADGLYDFTGCCPPDSDLLGSGYNGAVCMVRGYTAIVLLSAPAVDGLVDVGVACPTIDRLDTTKADYASCCPDGTEFVAPGVGGVLCGVR